jgi:predicted dehydrogenase
MKKNKVGIIGFGNVGKKHLAEFLKNKKLCKVVAICDFDDLKLAHIKKKFKSIRLYNDAEDLINDENVDIVSICSYDKFHYEQIIKCFKKKKNIFCEKPICSNHNEFLKLKKVLYKYKVFFGTNFNLRTAKSFQYLKNNIKNGLLGKVFHIEAGYESGRLYKIKNGWRGKDKNYSLVHGGMIHMIDLVLWLMRFFKEKRKYEVISQGNNICSEQFNYKNYDFITSSIKTKKILVTLKASWGCVTPHFHSLKLYGTKGTYINDFKYKGYFLKNNKLKFKKDLLSYKDRQRGETIRNFLNELNNRQLNNSTKKEILKTTQLSMAIHKSLMEKKKITISI